MNARRKIEEQLSAYMDGQVSQDQAEQIELALAQDERLARELAELRKVRRLVRDMPLNRAPEDFVSNVLGRAERSHLVLSHSAEDRDFSWARHLATAAVVLLAIGIGGVVGVTLWNTAGILRMQTVSAVPAAVRDNWPKNLKVDETTGVLELTDVNGDQIIVNNVDIYTDDLVDTRKAVENALHGNNLKLLTPDKAVKDAVVVNGALNNNAFGNYYNAQQVDGQQIRILAYVNDAQVPAIENTLENIRNRQQVSQVPAERHYIARGGAAESKYEDYSLAKVGKAGAGDGGRAAKSSNSLVQKGEELAHADQPAAPSPDIRQGKAAVPSDLDDQVAGQAAQAYARSARPALSETLPTTAAKPAGAGLVATQASLGGSSGVPLATSSQPVAAGQQLAESASQSKFNTAQSQQFTGQAGQSPRQLWQQSYNGRRGGSANESQRQNASMNNQAMLITINLRSRAANSPPPATSQSATQSQSTE